MYVNALLKWDELTRQMCFENTNSIDDHFIEPQNIGLARDMRL